MEKKICSKCKIEKDVCEFNKKLISNKGIQYYKELFSNVKVNLRDKKAKLILDLEKFELQLKNLPVHKA